MDKPRPKIRDVRALRVDASGRIGRLRVIGIADWSTRIRVQICVADLDAGPWCNEGPDAIARFVDPARTSVKPDQSGFGGGVNRTDHLWLADIDLLDSPAMPPLIVGHQWVPVNVRAWYVFDSDSDVTRTFDNLEPVEEFDVGVLFVHGIGGQRRAETLAQWSGPLLRWINAWLGGVTDDVSARLRSALHHGTDGDATRHIQESMEGWHDYVTLRQMASIDLDYVGRIGYAKNLVRKTLAPTYKDSREELQAVVRQATSGIGARSPTPLEKAAGDEVIHAINSIKVSAVGGSAEFRDAYVLDVGLHGADPSSVEMHVQAMASDGYVLRSRWLLAESHWAESFWAPPFFSFAQWCLLTAPVLLVHYIAMARLRHPMWARWMIGVFGLAVTVTLAQVGFLLLMVLRLIPWDRLQAGVLRLQIDLAGVVGDSYVLLEDPVQRRAILDRVTRNLDWLEQRCGSVVVIAHSQGAAVAESVLSQRREPDVDKVKAFATLGAGVQTLTAIGVLAKNRGARAAGWAAIASVLLLGCAIVLAALRVPVAIGLAIAGVIGVMVAAGSALRIHPGRQSTLPPNIGLRPWFDFFARRDLVPYGPVVTPGPLVARYKPAEVRNRDSFAADHVSYWDNPEQVVGPLARLIGSTAGFAPLARLSPDDDATLATLERSRLSRIRFLRAARVVALLTTGALLYTNWEKWAAIATWGLGWSQAKLGFGTAAGAAVGLPTWLHALLVFVPVVIYRSLLNAMFDGWTTVEVERLLKRSAGSPAAHWAVMFSTMLIAIVAGTIGYIWPVNWQSVAAGATASAIAVGWLAQRSHVKRTYAAPAAATLTPAKEST